MRPLQQCNFRPLTKHSARRVEEFGCLGPPRHFRYLAAFRRQPILCQTDRPIFDNRSCIGAVVCRLVCLAPTLHWLTGQSAAGARHTARLFEPCFSWVLGTEPASERMTVLCPHRLPCYPTDTRASARWLHMYYVLCRRGAWVERNVDGSFAKHRTAVFPPLDAPMLACSNRPKQIRERLCLLG